MLHIRGSLVDERLNIANQTSSRIESIRPNSFEYNGRDLFLDCNTTH
jgi:hypothetical protein